MRTRRIFERRRWSVAHARDHRGPRPQDGDVRADRPLSGSAERRFSVDGVGGRPYGRRPGRGVDHLVHDAASRVQRVLGRLAGSTP